MNKAKQIAFKIPEVICSLFTRAVKANIYVLAGVIYGSVVSTLVTFFSLMAMFNSIRP